MDMQINSDYIIPNIEQHFKVSAGPGAGKTHWLVGHIKNILTNSIRLGKTRSVACLTYSNVAVDNIKERLGTSTQQVEVSTIHSFLYKHIVRPYAFVVSENFGLDATKMDGHDEQSISWGKTVMKWQEETDQKYLTQISQKRGENKSDYETRKKKEVKERQIKIIKVLNSVVWQIDANDLVLNLPKGKYYLAEFKDDNDNTLFSIKKDSYTNIKQTYWQDGTLSHDDVLFFSYQIVKKHPFVLDVLRAKFPYFLIDEFQDTSPIQTAILKLLGENEIIVGVIGDPVQSIYGFQGANEKQFDSFSLTNMKTYEIADNRRSTIQIVDLLNHIRKEMPQNSCKDENGNDKINEKPILYIGAREKALEEIKKVVDNFYVLAFQNSTVTAIEHQQTGKSENLLKKLKEEDTTSERSRWIEACVKAVAFAQKDKFKDAIQEFVRLYRREAVKSKTPIDEFQKYEWKKKSLERIKILLSNLAQSKSIVDFSNEYLAKNGIFKMEIPKITTAKPAHQKTFEDYVKCVDIKEDTGNYRTIHKSKGDEFENTVLILEDEKEMDFLVKPNLSKEEHRVRYVAVSRAKKKLFICVPALNSIPNNINCIQIKNL